MGEEKERKEKTTVWFSNDKTCFSQKKKRIYR
jgi:hypothetical protein